MNSRTELDLLRLLRGDLPAAEAQVLRDRLAREAGLAAAYERLAAVWGTLEPPAPAPVPPGFTGRVMARVREETGSALAWAQAPGWVRAAAAASLLVGAALGAGLGAGLGTGRPATLAAAAAEVIAAIPSSRAASPLPSPVPIPPVGTTAAEAPVPPAPTPVPPKGTAGATEPGDGEMEEIETFEEAGPAGEDAFDEPGAASLAEGYWAAFGDDLGGDRGETLP